MALDIGSALNTIAYWGALLAAAGFSVLAFGVLRRLRPLTSHHLMLIVALLVMAVWLGVSAVFGTSSHLAAMFENMRNVAWLGFLYLLLRQAGTADSPRGLSFIFAALALVALLTMVVDISVLSSAGVIDQTKLLGVSRLVLHAIMVIGALVLVHNLYSVAAPDSRSLIAPYMAALTAMWGYDLNLYTITYLAGQPAQALIELRPLLSILLIPVFAVPLLKRGQMRFRLSRSVTFQSLSLMAIGIYLVAMVVVAAALRFLGGDYGDIAQKAFLLLAIVAAVMLVPSARFRSLMRVQINKHFFQHRYDYRTEWMRFTQTMGKPGVESDPFHARVIKAIADVTESPGGLLLLPDDHGGLVVESRWNARSISAPASAAELKTYLYLQETARIIDFDALRGRESGGPESALMPRWMMEDPRVWVGVPLIHFERLAGLVLLERPVIDRTLDWEDFDLLRIVGRQVASYLAEAQGQEALSEARRFEEFNRRFAFIIHDIKNLVSQLSLVARNAERHADNPEFRADMIETLQFSVGRMNDLLARLSQHNKGRPEDPHPVAIEDLIERVARSKRPQHAIITGADATVVAMADPNRVEQILMHLVQNAIDASPSTEPIQIMLRSEAGKAVIEVMDRGSGMSPDFIRNKLFKPFLSTKEGGFGIGVYEARSLAQAMGGRLDVESREGEGSLFRLVLPLVDPTLQSTFGISSLIGKEDAA